MWENLKWLGLWNYVNNVLDIIYWKIFWTIRWWNYRSLKIYLIFQNLKLRDFIRYFKYATNQITITKFICKPWLNRIIPLKSNARFGWYMHLEERQNGRALRNFWRKKCWRINGYSWKNWSELVLLSFTFWKWELLFN